MIVQYTPFSYPISLLQPEIDFSLGGKAHIFMGGKVIEGEWINRNGSIHSVDARGYDLPLKCGKTYVAGGETRTMMRNGVEENPYAKQQEAYNNFASGKTENFNAAA